VSAESGSGRTGENVAPEVLRDHFVAWQCRLRQDAVRRHGGRPSDGMRPQLEIEADDHVAVELTVLLVEREPRRTVAIFRNVIRRTNDLQRRYDVTLEILGARYYQYPENFSGALTALFGARSATVDCLVRLGRCVLHFEQADRYFRVPCRVEALKLDDPAFQATFWHNKIFNPDLPADVQVLAFRPNWERVRARPATG
jgi:hypothetical protein